MKKLISSLLFPVFLLGLILVPQNSRALTDSQIPTRVYPDVKVSGLAKKYKGMYLTAYFARISDGNFSFSNDQLNIDVIFAKIPSLYISGDSLMLTSPKNIPVSFQKPNRIVLVIHQQPTFTWINPDIEGASVGQPDLKSDANLTDIHSEWRALSVIRIYDMNGTRNVYEFIFPSDQ